MLSATTCHHEVHEEIEGEPTLSGGGSTIAVVVLQYLHALHGRLIVRLDSPNQYLATLHTSDAKELKRNWLSVGIGFNTVPALLCVSAGDEFSYEFGGSWLLVSSWPSARWRWQVCALDAVDRTGR